MFQEIKIALIGFLAKREANRLRQKRVINKRSYLKHRLEILKREREQNHLNREANRIESAARYRRKKAELGLNVKTIRKHGERTPEIHREECRKAVAKYQRLHPDRCASSSAKWYRKVKSKMMPIWIKRAVAYKRSKYGTDPLFTLTDRIRVRIRHAIKVRGIKRPNKTIKILGCSFSQLKAYIKNQFTVGMTWEAVMSGKIHLDHKIPIAAFDLSDDAQLRRAFHYTNLQPLWWDENLRKSNKILPEFAGVFKTLANEAASN